jgi:hypothetical protein
MASTDEKIIVTVIASPTLHRPEPIRFGAPHGVHGEWHGDLVFAWDCFVVPRFAGLLPIHATYVVCISNPRRAK